MNKSRTSIRKYKNISLFLIIIFVFGLISGALFYYNQDISIRKNIILMDKIFNHNIFDVKNVFIHLGIILIIIATSFIFLGSLINIITVFIEGISIGFIIPIFASLYKIKSLLVFSIYFLTIKLLYLLLLGCLFIFTIKFSREYFMYFKSKKNIFFNSLKKMFLVCFLVILNDFMIYFLFNKLLIFIFG